MAATAATHCPVAGIKTNASVLKPASLACNLETGIGKLNKSKRIRLANPVVFVQAKARGGGSKENAASISVTETSSPHPPSAAPRPSRYYTNSEMLLNSLLTFCSFSGVFV